MLFNASVSELWRRTTIYALRALGNLAGMSVRAVAKEVRLSYVKVVEFQRRGSVHLHALVRLDGPATAVASAATFRPSCWPSPLEVAARRGVGHRVAGVKGQRARAGALGSGARRGRGDRRTGNGRRRAAAYLAKYSTKSTDDRGVLDHRLKAGVPEKLDLAPQLRRLVQAAWELGGQSHLENLHLRAWAHTLGFRGHFATKSRRYSTTFGMLRAVRQVWRVSQSDAKGHSRASGEGRIVCEVLKAREWQVTGMGYRTCGDAWIAEGLARTARDARKAIYVERCFERGEAT